MIGDADGTASAEVRRRAHSCSACSAGDLSMTPGRTAWRRDRQASPPCPDGETDRLLRRVQTARQAERQAGFSAVSRRRDRRRDRQASPPCPDTVWPQEQSLGSVKRSHSANQSLPGEMVVAMRLRMASTTDPSSKICQLSIASWLQPSGRDLCWQVKPATILWVAWHCTERQLR